jgi:NADH dehydrogenase (ubiquinone) 1 beta subcomplex subunit 8
MQMRRNFGDTVSNLFFIHPTPPFVLISSNRQMHEREEMYSMWGPDISHVDPATALRHFAIAASGFVAFGLLCNYALVPDRPAVPRQYPFDGLVKELGGLEENKVRPSQLTP